MSRIAILGGGSWGTGLAVVLANSRRKHDLRLWVRDPSLADSIERDRENKKYLPGVTIPPCVRASSNLEALLHEAQIVVGAVPSAHTRAIFASALPHVSRDAVFVSATKGLEPATHLRMSEVISQVLNTRFVPPVAVLSGPSFAAEAAQGHPTAVVLASPDAALAAFLQEEFSGPSFRLYTNDDVMGVELAGAMAHVAEGREQLAVRAIDQMEVRVRIVGGEEIGLLCVGPEHDRAGGAGRTSGSCTCGSGTCAAAGPGCPGWPTRGRRARSTACPCPWCPGAPWPGATRRTGSRRGRGSSCRRGAGC